MIDRRIFELRSAAALKLALVLSEQPEALSWSDRELAERIHAPEASVRRGRAELREAGLIREVWIGAVQLDPADPDIEVEIGPDQPDQPDRGQLHLVELSPDIEVEIGRDPSDLADPDIEVEIGPDQPDQPDRGDLHLVQVTPDLDGEDTDGEDTDGEDDPALARDHASAVACDHARPRARSRDQPLPLPEEQESRHGTGRSRGRAYEAPGGAAIAMPAEGGEGEVRRGAPRSPDWKRGRWSEVKAQFKATWHKLAAQEVLRGTAPALGEVEGELRAAGLPPEAALSALVWLVWRTRPRTSQLPHQPSGAGLYRVILREQIERGGLAAWGAAPPPTLHELAAVWRGLSPEGLLQERGLDLGDGADEGETGSEGSFQAPPPPENALQTPRNEVAEAFSPRGDELVEARQVLARVRAALGLSGMSLAVALEGAIQAGDVARVRAASETARELLALKGAA